MQLAVWAGALWVGLLLSGSAWAQGLANDDPCGAVVLTPQGQLCSAPTVGTNQGATTTTPNGYVNTGTCGGGGSGGLNAALFRDVWYQFTTAATGLGSTGATITVSGNAAGQIRLFSAASCAGPFADIDCSAAAATSTTAPPLITTALTASTTYYVRVAGFDGNSATGAFTICVTDGPGLVFCPGFTVGPPVYTNAGNTAATFTFTPNANNVGPYTATLQLNPFNGQNIPPPIVFTVTPPTVTVTGLVTGTNYTLTIRGFCTTGGSVAGGQSFTVPAPNDEPCGAFVLPVDLGATCNPVSGTITGATPTAPNGYTNPGCGVSGPLTVNDVWYKFTTPASGPGSNGLVLTLDNVAAAQQLRVFAASSCTGPFALLGCTGPSATTNSAVPLVLTGLVPNTTYYVEVAGTPVSSGNTFALCASAQAPVFPCPALSQFGTSSAFITAYTALLGLVPVVGSTPPVSYTVTYTSASGPPITITIPYAPNGTSLSTYLPLTGLQPNTTYTATAVVNCVGGGQSPALNTTFTTPASPGTPPANDECTGATPLPVNTTCVPLTTTNLNATDAPLQPNLPLPNCAPFLGADVWYSVVVPANGIVQVTTGGVPGSVVTDTGLTLYRGTCGALTQIACNDNISAANLFSQVRGTGLAAGSTVYARAYRVSSVVGGDFTICATTDVTCPLVTNLTTSTLTPASATLTFTLPAGNTGYVLTYTRTGGTPQTQPITASPVVLTGLLPSTTYTVTITGSCPGSLAGTVRTTFTTPAVPACAAPTSVYASNVGNTSAGIGFVLNPGAGSYTVTYQAAGGPMQTVSPAPTASPVTLTGLVPGTSYTVCVASACTNGLASIPRCAPSFTTTGTAPTCTAPATATAASTGPTTASVTFMPAAGVASYTVTYTAAGGTPQTLTPNPTASPVALTGLVPGVTYTVTVASNCAGGTSSLPVLATFATPLASRSGALADQLGLSPNPAHHSATLTVPAAALRQASLLTLSDALGRTVRQRYVTPTAGTATDTRAELDLTGLPTGVYLVRLLSSAGPLTKRLVIE